MSNVTEEVLEIKITPEDEVTIVDRKWVTSHGFGSTSTISRKMKTAEYPQSISDDGDKWQWTLAQWKRYLQKKLARLNQQAAA